MSEDARTLLRTLAYADHREGVRGAVACARWALERYWTDEGDRHPWETLAVVERWLRGEATAEECGRAAQIAVDAVGSAGFAALAAAAVADSVALAVTNPRSNVAWSVADVAALAAAASGNEERALRDLCDVIERGLS